MQQLRSPQALIQHHEALLFLAAYPRDKKQLAMVQAGLRRIHGTIKKRITSEHNWQAALLDSGIAGSTREDSFSYELLEWLASHSAAKARFLEGKEDLGEALSDSLQNFALHVAADAAISPLSSSNLLSLTQSGGLQGKVLWLAHAFRQLEADELLKDQLFEAHNLWVRWEVAPALSRTFTRFPSGRACFQAKRPSAPFELGRYIDLPLKRAPPMSLKKAKRLMQLGRAVLAVRGRETDPVTYAAERDVHYFDAGEGINVCLYGLRPARRLAIESYIGFVLAKNGVPIGYGGAWILGTSCEIGVNIFETFRGGDSARVFGAVMRVYRQFYGIKTFFVHPNQFGADNAEGLSSGAFWFYYKLGFRSVDAKINQLARRESSRRVANQRYRSSVGTLRRLCTDSLVFRCDTRDEAGALDVRDIGVALVDFVRRRFKGDFCEAEKVCAKHLLTWAGRVPVPRDIQQRHGLVRLSVIFEALPETSKWSRAERSALAKAFCAKGGARESDFIRSVQRHARLLAGLAYLARRGRRIAEKLEA